MKIAIWGAGRRALAAARDLLAEPDLETLSIVPRSGEEAMEARRRLTDPRLQVALPSTPPAEALRGIQAAIFPIGLDPELTRQAIRAGCHVIGGVRSASLLRQLLELDREAAAARVAVMPAMGLAPGIANAIAADLVERFDRCDSIRMRVGGLPVRAVGPLGISSSLPLDDLLDDYAGDVEILRGGEKVKLPALSEPQPFDLPAPFGRAEAALTGAGLSLMTDWLAGRVRTLEFRTVRHVGHFERVRLLGELGLLSEQEWDLPGGVRLAPRALLGEAIRRASSYPDVADLALLRITAEGTVGGEPVRAEVEVLDFGEPAVKVSAVDRMAAYPMAAAARLLLRDEAPRVGAFPPEQALPWIDLRRELESRGLRFTDREETLARGASSGS